MKYAVLAGRQLFSIIFIIASAGHFSRQTIESAARHGVPMAGAGTGALGKNRSGGRVMPARESRRRSSRSSRSLADRQSVTPAPSPGSVPSVRRR